MQWTGQSGFMIKAAHATIVVDPFKLPDIDVKADVLLITHPHFDHFSKDDIAKVVTKDTKIFCSGGCDGIEEFGNHRIAKPGSEISADGIRISTVPAYNVKQERLKFHPKSNLWVGYIIEYEGRRIYHAGDTDFIDEMRSLKNLDLALLPMGGTYTMAIEEGISAAKSIDAKSVAPIHYRMLLGDERAKELEEKFSREVGNALILSETH